MLLFLPKAEGVVKNNCYLTPSKLELIFTVIFLKILHHLLLLEGSSEQGWTDF